MTESQAANYEHGSNSQRIIGTKIIKELEISKGSTVLDLGCGTGYLTKVLSESVGPQGKVVAVDPDGDRLAIAIAKYPSSNIEYIQVDDKTFPPGEYDVIFSNLVIHWIDDKEALFNRVYANLRPGGCFVFCTPNDCYPIPEIGKNLFSTMINPNFLHEMLNRKMKFLNEMEYEAMGDAIGFSPISVKTIDHFPKWKNLDEYIDSMHGWFHGGFDPTRFDQDTLQAIKKEYGEGPIAQPKPITLVHAILTKPSK
jgi:ubiquinone/menaquinone biosynthesis C-methylase UbiE